MKKWAGLLLAFLLLLGATASAARYTGPTLLALRSRMTTSP